MRAIFRAGRAALALSALGLIGGLGACESLLEVENPGTVTETDLGDTTLINDLAAAPVGQFNSLYANYAYASAVLGDEAVSGHNFTQWQDVDARNIGDNNAGYGEYVALHRLRYLGNNMGGRLREMLGDRAASDPRVAMAYAMEGYALTLLAESHCESPLAPDAAASTSEEIFQAAIPVYENAITVATAAGSSGTTVLNMARVGLARTYLNLGNFAKAVEYAALVPANFVAFARYSDLRTELYNPFVGATVGQNFNLGVDAKFQGLNDPRIRHDAEKGGHNPIYPVAAPFQTPSFSGWNPAAASGFAYNTDIRFASGLEAQYIVAEAQGPNATNVAFLNARRAVGSMTPVAADISATDFRAALREQRARDFFLDGHRLGDLRRYKKLYGVDEFPSGVNPNPGPQYVNYGSAECFAPTVGERIGNPNY